MRVQSDEGTDEGIPVLTVDEEIYGACRHC